MKQYSRLISLAGGVISFFSFSLPWEGSVTGIKLANHSSGDGGGLIVTAFIASLIIISVNLMLNRKTIWKSWVSKIVVFISSIIGLFCFSVVLFDRSLYIDSGNFFNEIEFGAFLSAIGFIIAIVSVWNYPKTTDISESEDETDEMSS